jgi:hypothetical protein
MTRRLSLTEPIRSPQFALVGGIAIAVQLGALAWLAAMKELPDSNWVAG